MACIERTNNTIDAHVECSISRITQDTRDLSIVIKALQEEHIFEPNNVHIRKIMNGMIIHEKIIESIVTMHTRGSQCMSSFIQERYIDRSVNLADRLLAMVRLKLSEPYHSNQEQTRTDRMKKTLTMAKALRTADNTIKDIVSLSFFRVSLSLVVNIPRRDSATNNTLLSLSPLFSLLSPLSC